MTAGASEIDAAPAVNDGAQSKSLEFLFEYTKFHIGVYLTVTTAYIAAANIKVGSDNLLHIQPELLVVAVILFIVAGMAGGVIISSITQSECSSSREFLRQPIGPWLLRGFKALYWTWIEHTAFWAGLIAAVCSFWPPSN